MVGFREMVLAKCVGDAVLVRYLWGVAQEAFE